jgi:hypothetical protein
MTFRFILKSSGVLRDESAEPSARDNLSQNLTKQSSSLRLVLGSRSQGFNLKVPGCALKVLACRAFEPALAGIPLVTIHACHAHVPATPWTRTPGDGLVAWGSELRVVHQALAVLGIRSIYARLAHKAVQYCSLQNGPSAAYGQSAAIGADGESIYLDYLTAGRQGTVGQQGQRHQRPRRLNRLPASP